MQNIDFSSKKMKSAQEVDKGTTQVKEKNRSSIMIISLMLLAFTAGLIVGIPFGKWRGVEKDLVRYSDDRKNASHNIPEEKKTKVEEQKGEESFANVSNLPPSEGNFVIKVGSFAFSEAKEIEQAVNKADFIKDIKHLPCRGLNKGTSQSPAFRTKAAKSKENVFIGCFASEVEARDVLGNFHHSSIKGASGARLFEIE